MKISATVKLNSKEDAHRLVDVVMSLENNSFFSLRDSTAAIVIWEDVRIRFPKETIDAICNCEIESFQYCNCEEEKSKTREKFCKKWKTTDATTVVRNFFSTFNQSNGLIIKDGMVEMEFDVENLVKIFYPWAKAESAESESAEIERSETESVEVKDDSNQTSEVNDVVKSEDTEEATQEKKELNIPELDDLAKEATTFDEFLAKVIQKINLKQEKKREMFIRLAKVSVNLQKVTWKEICNHMEKKDNRSVDSIRFWFAKDLKNSIFRATLVKSMKILVYYYECYYKPGVGKPAEPQETTEVTSGASESQEIAEVTSEVCETQENAEITSEASETKETAEVTSEASDTQETAEVTSEESETREIAGVTSETSETKETAEVISEVSEPQETAETSSEESVPQDKWMISRIPEIKEALSKFDRHMEIRPRIIAILRTMQLKLESVGIKTDISKYIEICFVAVNSERIFLGTIFGKMDISFEERNLLLMNFSTFINQYLWTFYGSDVKMKVEEFLTWMKEKVTADI